MCGVLFSNRRSINESKFVDALATIRHRGPDAQAFEQVNYSWLGHTRLSVLDLDSRSNQPFHSSDGRYVMIYNGEIYNYRELLSKYGLSAQTTSDTELVIELYSKVGPAMLQDFIGMFAIIILDKISNEVFVARDRLGVKPLYFHEDENGVTYSSEIAAVRKLVPNLGFDSHGIEQYRTLRMFAGGHSLFKGISIFPAGTYSLNGELTRYWDLPHEPQSAPEDEELLELIQSSVNFRMIADVPVGSYLSGGIDSSIVSAISKVSHTWSVGTVLSNEFIEAQQTSDVIGSIHHNALVDDSDFIQTAKWMIDKRQEPLCVPNEVLLYKLNQQVKPLNTVMLSGEGADELFAGYFRIFDWAARTKTFNLVEFAKLYCYTDEPNLEIVESVIAPHIRETPYETVSSFFQIEHLHGLLRRVDNSSMLCGIEARVPFVDHRLVERLYAVDYSWKNANGISKAPLRRLAERFLPHEIAYRKKVGFPVDVNGILEREGFQTKNNPYDSWYEFNAAQLGIN